MAEQNAIQAINALQTYISSLPVAQQQLIKTNVLKNVNILTLSEAEAMRYLAQSRAVIASSNVGSHITNSMTERANTLRQKANMDESIMLEARQHYYELTKAIPTDHNSADYAQAVQKRDSAFNTYMTKSELFNWSAKRANSAEFYADVAQNSWTV